MKNTLKVNWYNLLGCVLLVIATAKITNWWDYNRSSLSGWSLLGFVLLMVAVVVVGALIALSIWGDAKWAVLPGFILGCIVTAGCYWFVNNMDVRWQDVLWGLLIFGGIGALIASICVTRWVRHPNAIRNNMNLGTNQNP